MNKIITVCLYILVIVPLMSYITKKCNEEKDANESIKNFEVCIPIAYLMIFCAAGWFFIGIFLFIYLYNGFGFANFDEIWLYAGAITAGSIFVLWLIFKLWRMDVDNEIITYRTFWGYKKITTFSSIDNVQKTDHYSLVIYADKKRFGTINSDFIGIDNFLKRCEKENIEIRPRARRTLTKMQLYFRSMKAMFWIGGIPSLIIFLMCIFEKGEVRYKVLEAFFLALFLFLTVVFPASFYTIRGLLHIGMQERALGFSFVKEMNLYNIRGGNFVNEQWFIDIDVNRIVAFRHDYIKSIGKVETSPENENKHKVSMVSVNGTILNIKSSYGTLERLREWSKQTPIEIEG